MTRMEKIKILVVEDEFIVSQTITNALEEIGYEVVGQAFDAEEARAMMAQEKPDLVMLDITLRGGEDGIAVAQHIRSEYTIPFIFLTSHSDPNTLARAKEVRPPGYLLKPFQKSELYVAVELALYNHAQDKEGEPQRNNPDRTVQAEEDGGAFRSGESLFVRQNQGYRKISIAEIRYLKSDRIYVEIYTREQKPILVRESLQSFEEKLGTKFLRIHRSYLVNLQAIESFDTHSLYIQGEELPLGKAQREELLIRLRNG